jgi:hypothetical protein
MPSQRRCCRNRDARFIEMHLPKGIAEKPSTAEDKSHKL